MLRKLKSKFQENLSRPGIIDARARRLRNTALKHVNNFGDHISIVKNNSISQCRLVVSKHLTMTTKYANKNCIRPTYFMQTRV